LKFFPREDEFHPTIMRGKRVKAHGLECAPTSVRDSTTNRQ
jgi:hypothetical protein